MSRIVENAKLASGELQLHPTVYLKHSSSENWKENDVIGWSLWRLKRDFRKPIHKKYELQKFILYMKS